MTPIEAAKLILVLPLAAFVIQVLTPVSWRGGKNRQGDFIPTFAMALATLAAFWLFYGQVVTRPHGIQTPIHEQIALGAPESEASIRAGVERTLRVLDRDGDGLVAETDLGGPVLAEARLPDHKEGFLSKEELLRWRSSPRNSNAWCVVGELLPVDRARSHQGYVGAHAATLRFDFGFLIDNLTAIMLVVVTTVSLLVHVYSMGYMRDHHGQPAPRYGRFFAFLGLFTFSMLGLVLTDNLFMLFVFWELVGVCSYFLIGFEFERPAAQVAQIKAFMTTRVGDVFFFIGIMMIGGVVGSFRFDDIFASIPNGAWEAHPWLLATAAILIFIGPVGKSAQFPLHVWLPDAMEGPTPVSALIHAATMVAAGVYLVARMFPFFAGPAWFGELGSYFDSTPLAVVAFTGGVTALFAATIALVQNDIKKVLAYSTISQLGYMMLGIGVGSFSAGMFHLWTHAFFKALLFLGSGSVIHAVGTNDMREMGGLRSKMPITFWTFLIATAAISGVPFLSGFYSKEAILTQALAFGLYRGHLFILPFAMGMLTAGLTAFYMFRIIFMTFTGEPRNEHRYDHAHESPPSMWVPLAVLCGFTVLSAGVLGMGSDWFHNRVSNVLPAQIVKVGYPELARKMPLLAAAGLTAAVPHGAPEHGAPEHGAPEHGAPAHEGAAHEGAAHEAAYVTWPAALDEEGRERAHQIPLLLSLFAATLGIGLCAAVFAGPFRDEDLAPRGTWLGAYRRVLEKLYYVDDLYAWAFIRPVMAVRLSLAWFDRKVIDRVVDWVGEAVVWTSQLTEKLDRRSLGMGRGAQLAALSGLVAGLAACASATTVQELVPLSLGPFGSIQAQHGVLHGVILGAVASVAIALVCVAAGVGRGNSVMVGLLTLLGSAFGAEVGVRVARWATGQASTNLGLVALSHHPVAAGVVFVLAFAVVVTWWAGLGVDGSVRWISETLVLSISRATRRIQTGRLQDYLFATVVGIVAIIFLVAIV